MFRMLLALIFLTSAFPALAWNAAGHRLSAVIAWQYMAPATRAFVADSLRLHPDHAEWANRAGAADTALILAEASTWPDRIRHDTRFHDERREPPALPVAGLFDQARHVDWHYVDFHDDGRRGKGNIDRALAGLVETLRSTGNPAEIAWALPWLVHLVGDLHQPMHVGRAEDAGGNDVLVEDSTSPKKPFVKLHAWWDELPGRSDLRGKRLNKRAGQLLLSQTAASPAFDIDHWRDETHALLAGAYPLQQGSVSLLIDADFRRRAESTAAERIVSAGLRLGRLLDDIVRHRVSRGTAP